MGRERMDYVSLFVGDCPLSQTVRIEERILMLAYTYIEKGKFQLTQKPKPVLQGERDAVVRVTLSSICTSDLHIRHGSVPRAVPGITVGHEMVGVVESVGAEVTDLKPGDRVTVNKMCIRDRLEADSGYIYDSVRKLTKAGVDSCSLKELPVNTVLLTSRAPIGKVGLAGETLYCNQGFKNIICKDRVLPKYLYFLLLFNVDYLNLLGRGATFKEISKKIVENIKIPVPPLNLQEQFSAFVTQVDKSKSGIQKSLKETQLLFDSLMQEYFG